MDEATFETRLREILALQASQSARALTELDVLIDRLMNSNIDLAKKRERLMQGLREKVSLLYGVGRDAEAHVIGAEYCPALLGARKAEGRR
jgi:hypothetical protein